MKKCWAIDLCYHQNINYVSVPEEISVSDEDFDRTFEKSSIVRLKLDDRFRIIINNEIAAHIFLSGCEAVLQFSTQKDLISEIDPTKLVASTTHQEF